MGRCGSVLRSGALSAAGSPGGEVPSLMPDPAPGFRRGRNPAASVPEERRQLRRDVQDAGRDVYGKPLAPPLCDPHAGGRRLSFRPAASKARFPRIAPCPGWCASVPIRLAP